MHFNENQFKQGVADFDISEITDLLWETESHLYHTKPVDIETFVTDPFYLGKIYGGMIFPIWMDLLKKVYPAPLYCPYYEVILSCCIGAGKTSVATISLAYDIYRMACLINPQQYYGLAPGTKMVFALFSADKNLAAAVNWEYFQNIFTLSPYFIELLGPRKTKSIPAEGYHVTEDIIIAIGSRIQHALGKAVFGCLLDEASFQSEASNQAQKSYTGLLRRMESRFMDSTGAIPGIMWLVSSPKDASDFLGERIAKAENNKKSLVKDNIALWDAKKHIGLADGPKFQVYTGSPTRDPHILLPNEKTKPDESHLVIDVPEKFRASFENDLMDSLKDLAGIRTAGAINLFKSVQVINSAATIDNIFNRDLIELDFEDKDDLLHNYVNLDYFRDIRHPESYRFVHLDVATTNDKYGLASAYAVPRDSVIYESDTYTQQMLERSYYIDWTIGIKAKEGKEIPLYKMEQFIIFLRDVLGYPILKVSADQFQSKRTLQTMELNKFETQTISVDRTRDPYLFNKEMLYRKALLMPRNNRLVSELANLRDDGKKIDHPVNGSKDLSDAGCGALWSCAKSEIILTSKAMLDRAFDYSANEAMSNSKRAVMREFENGNDIFGGYFNGL